MATLVVGVGASVLAAGCDVAGFGLSGAGEDGGTTGAGVAAGTEASCCVYSCRSVVA